MGRQLNDFDKEFIEAIRDDLRKRRAANLGPNVGMKLGYRCDNSDVDYCLIIYYPPGTEQPRQETLVYRVEDQLLIMRKTGATGQEIEVARCELANPFMIEELTKALAHASPFK
jgi:hypothetical protein